MSETDLAQFESKTPEQRTIMHVLYGLHTISWASVGILAVIALIVNYIRRGDEHDAVFLSHHDYMISTFWWTLLWLVLCAPLWFLLVFPGAAAYTVIGLWYLYRCIRGWLRFVDGKVARP